MNKQSNKIINKFLEKSFYQFGSNSIYKPKDFKNLLITSAQGNDFIETSSSVLKEVNADTLFLRIENFTDIDKVMDAFDCMLEKTLKMSGISKNRFFTIAVDITYEPYYGKRSSPWIHDYKPKEGWTGSFWFIEVSIVEGISVLFCI